MSWYDLSMRWVFSFYCLFLMCVVTGDFSSVYAQSQLSETQINHSKRSEYAREAEDAYTQCELQHDYEKAYDCRCIGIQLYEVRLESQDFFSHSEIVRDALPECKNAPKLSFRYYEQCLSWAASTRKDAKEFCECYGNAIGRNFERRTFSSGREEEGIMVKALLECDFGKPAKERQERERQKRDLQERGLFERLFPSFYSSSDTDE